MIEFEKVRPLVLDSEGAMRYLAITTKSTLETLIRQRRITAIRYTQGNRFAISELDDFIVRELAAARQSGAPSESEAEGT